MTAPAVVDAPESVFHDAAWMARRIGMGLDWVRHNTSRLPHHRVGSKVRFTEDNVREFMAATKVDPAPAASDGAAPVQLVGIPTPTARSRAARARRERGAA